MKAKKQVPDVFEITPLPGERPSQMFARFQVDWLRTRFEDDANPIYAWEAYFGADDAQYEAILPVYQEFVANHPDVRGLIRGINKDEIYPWWDGDAEAWVSWIGDAGDAIMVAVQFDGGAQDSAENPELTQLWFPNLPSYDEWWVASSSEAVAIAFQEVEIATALRGKSWTTEAELAEGESEIWFVRFIADGEAIVTANVDIDSGEILNYEIVG